MSDKASSAAAEPGPGGKIAGYLLEEQIGQGGMAVVYRATDERLDRRVALKLLAPAIAADTAFRQRFIRESRAAAAVDHPNIIPVYDAGDAGGALFIAMRYVQGGDVRSLLRQAGPLPAARVLSIIAQVAAALDAAHGRGLIHRDVKPANILLDVSGPATGPKPDSAADGQTEHVYLSDFGISKQSLASHLTATGQFIGTLDYIAPEQIEGQQVDGRADLYSLACTAFEILCGSPPFERDQLFGLIAAHLSEPPPSLTARRADLPAAVDQVLAKAMAKSPDDRYATCVQFATDLGRALGLVAGELQSQGGPLVTGASGAGAQPKPWPATELAGRASGPTAAPGNLDTPGVQREVAPVPNLAAPLPAPLSNVDPATIQVDQRQPAAGNWQAGAGHTGQPVPTGQQGPAPGTWPGPQGPQHPAPGTWPGAQGAAPGTWPGPQGAAPGTWPGPQGAAPGTWPAGSQAGPYGPYGPYPPGAPGGPGWQQHPPARRSRGLLTGAIVAVLAVAAAAAFAFVYVNHNKHGSSTPTAAPSASTSPVPSPTLSTQPSSASSQAAAVSRLLTASSASRSMLQNPLFDIENNCPSLSGDALASDVATIQSADNQRQSEYNEAQALDTSDLPNGQLLQSDLVQALLDSLNADNDYLAYAQEEQSSCFTPPSESNAFNSGQAASRNANPIKVEFANLWDQIAPQYNLPTVSSGSI